jgi:RHS repeat-associated protein
VAYKSGSTTLETMAYDGLNRRIVTSTGTAADLYYSKDWQVLEERSDGTTTAQYVWSPVYVDALVERDRGSERLYAQQDANWNTTAMVDNTGTVQERNVYDPYGQVTVLTPSWGSRGTSAYAWIYLHQGGRFDGVMGLYYFRQRDYSPGLGRWMQQDPVALLAGDNNLYRGEDDSPVTRVDPLGLSTQWKPGVWPSARQFYINWYNGCPREDFEIFWKGCVGLASLRCGLQGKFPTLAEGVRCFKKQSVAEDELKKLKCEKWQRPMMFAVQFNAYKKPETERNFGNPDEIDPLSIDPGSGYNFATWHDLDGETQYWEWMWGSFVCDERKGDSVPIHHDKNLPGEGPGEARKYKEKAFCIMCANKCSWTVPRINKDTGAYEFPENPPKK